MNLVFRSSILIHNNVIIKVENHIHSVVGNMEIGIVLIGTIREETSFCHC